MIEIVNKPRSPQVVDVDMQRLLDDVMKGFPFEAAMNGAFVKIFYDAENHRVVSRVIDPSEVYWPVIDDEPDGGTTV